MYKKILWLRLETWIWTKILNQYILNAFILNSLILNIILNPNILKG